MAHEAYSSMNLRDADPRAGPGEMAAFPHRLPDVFSEDQSRRSRWIAPMRTPSTSGATNDERAAVS